MDCKVFGECGSCALNLDYEAQIAQKTEFIKDLFAPYFDGKIDIFTSQKSGYRTRAEFGIFRDLDALKWTMHGKNTKRVFIDECQKVDEKIANLMDEILREILLDESLKFKVFGCEFIATRLEITAILLYHRDVREIGNALENLHKTLQKKFNLNLIARSRGRKLVFGSESLHEILHINGRKFSYEFGDSAFIQPNTRVNEKMISWALDVVGGENLRANIDADVSFKNPARENCVSNLARISPNSDQISSNKSSKIRDLFELYCGHGNFTIPLSAKFRRVLANEISKSSIEFARKNAQNNGANNINFVRMSSEEIIRAINGEEFFRTRELNFDDYDFSHIFVDPPRAGLEMSVINFIKNYDNIIYISCNPATAAQNLSILSKTHKVLKMAIFDQFPHTNHIECGIILSKI